MKNIYCIVGPSGAGKTTVAEQLQKLFGFVPVESYTTRPARHNGEAGHIFVSKEQFDALGEMVAYTRYNGHEYGVTSDIIDRCDTYVIDPPGVEYMLQRYHGRKGVVVICLSADRTELAARMRKRGDSEEQIARRLQHDAEVFDYSRYGFRIDLMVNAVETAQTVALAKKFIDMREANDYDVRIFQINPERDRNRLMYACAEILQQATGDTRVDMNIYDEVWSGNMPVEHLDDVYLRFNRDDRPRVNRMHSLSVADIVEIRHNENDALNGLWFCDSFGWREIRDGRLIMS